MQILNCFLPVYELKHLYRNFHVIQRRTIIVFITVIFLFNNNVYIIYFSLVYRSVNLQFAVMKKC